MSILFIQCVEAFNQPWKKKTFFNMLLFYFTRPSNIEPRENVSKNSKTSSSFTLRPPVRFYSTKFFGIGGRVETPLSGKLIGCEILRLTSAVSSARLQRMKIHPRNRNHNSTLFVPQSVIVFPHHGLPPWNRFLVCLVLAGGQARDVQLGAGHDVRPDRVAFPDPVRHAPAGRADRAQAAGHVQDRLRQQVRRPPQPLISVRASHPVAASGCKRSVLSVNRKWRCSIIQQRWRTREIIRSSASQSFNLLRLWRNFKPLAWESWWWWRWCGNFLLKIRFSSYFQDSRFPLYDYLHTQ